MGLDRILGSTETERRGGKGPLAHARCGVPTLTGDCRLWECSFCARARQFLTSRAQMSALAF